MASTWYCIGSSCLRHSASVLCERVARIVKRLVVMIGGRPPRHGDGRQA